MGRNISSWNLVLQIKNKSKYISISMNWLIRLVVNNDESGEIAIVVKKGAFYRDRI